MPQLQADVLWLEMDEIGMLLEPGHRKQKAKKIAVLVMVDVATRYMAARTIPDEKGPTLQKALERAWIQFHGPPKQLYTDEGTGWASDATSSWCEQHDIELRISPGQAHTRTSIVERRHQLVRKAVSVFMLENELKGLDGVHQALAWVVPAVNSNTFVNGLTPSQLALGREPSLPGLISDERTGPLQLQVSEQERLHRRLAMKFSAQQACGKAEIDVKLRRALLRRYGGRDEDLHPGERCLYWRDAADKAHTIRWKGPAIVLAIERNPDTGTIACYWLAHGTVLLRAGSQHVRKLVNDSGMVNGSDRVKQALHDLRQRRAVRIIDLRKSNKRSIDEVDPEISDLDYTPTDTEAPPLTMSSPAAPDGLESGNSLEPPTSRVRIELPAPEVHPSQQEGHDEPQLELPDLHDHPELASEDEEQPMDEPPHMSTPMAPPDPAHLPPVPEDDDLDLPDPNEPPHAGQHELPPQQASSSAPPVVDATYHPPEIPESFQDRRRRFDQQETIWARKKARTDEIEVEVDLHSFDLTKSNALPSGWHYDVKNNEFVLGATQDWWSFEDGFLVRNHVWGRTTTYHPEEFPIDKDLLQTTTGLSMQQGSRTIYVNSSEEQHFNEAWTGKTLYPLTSTGAEQYGLHYIGDLTNKLNRCRTLRGRGHIWQAVGAGAGAPKKKNVKESADLNERHMSLEDRLSFLEGKKAELSSIFENGVWEIEMNPETVDHSRVMKARFVLKWAADGKGGLKAKARLVLQGFSDPNLLQGALDTSSPTLSRTSRQVLLAISQINHWQRWTADVSTAFLQGDPQERVLWAKIPRDACNLIGVAPGTLMKLIKPIYGQADAPRQWFMVARRRLESLGFRAHPLDQCLYTYYDSNKALISMVGLHVDDLLGCGKDGAPEYEHLKNQLKEAFNFKHWTEESTEKPLEFCGCHLSRNATESKLHQAEYLKNVKPMTCTDYDANRNLSTKEQSCLRALLGALQWPATQTSPHLSASVSLLCGEVTSATGDTAAQANKVLRFAKSNSDAALTFRDLGGDMEKLCMVAMSDAAWGVRRNNESQGGYVVFLCNQQILEDGSTQDYTILDWRSFKLPRVSRSSLNAESQACSAAMDALEYLLIFWEGCIRHDFQLRQVDDFTPEMASALVVDAQALYDSLKAETPSLQGDKRTKIEVMVTKQKMLSVKSRLKWVSSEAQLADGVTKFSARQLFADRLRSHHISLKADMSFQASKKKTMAERQASARRHAITKTGNSKHLAFAVLTSQMIGVKAVTMEDTLTFMLSPEAIMILYTMALGMLLWQFFRCCSSTSWRSSITRTTWTMTSTSSMAMGTQTEKEPETDLKILMSENLRLQDIVRDQEAEMFDLQAQCSAQEEEIEQLIDTKRYMQCELRELEGELNRTRNNWIDVHNRLASIQDDLAREWLPRTLFTTKSGKSFHTTPECQALSSADHSQMKQWDCCAYCGQKALERWRIDIPPALF